MNLFEILPSRATYRTEDSVEIEVRGLPESGELSVWHLGKCVSRMTCDRDGFHSLGRLTPGGYGIEVSAGTRLVRTALEVTTNPNSRLRYGFVVDYSPERDLAGVLDNIRRLHLSGIQFYDWAYRHADLLGGGDTYLDALDQPISQKTVKKLVSGVQSIGSAALGYAAVYAVGLNEWNLWKHDALLTAEGVPYSLGDFLFIVDPASPDWLEHFTEDLSAASESIGFDGFHLDQYGYPKNARRADGAAVDVANSFIKVIESARKSLPNSRLIFNNVNDFPTWKTAQTSQNAVYIEVWPPHVTLNSLAAVVNRAKHLSGDKPVVIAAYQHVYDGASATESDLATKFTMATLFSHGATQLLAGEADRILVDPYYVRNHQTAFSTQNMLRSWYDFLVEHDQILMSPDIVDVTGSFVGPYNDDCDVSFKDVRVNDYAEPGIIWRRIVKTKEQLVIHLINTLGQENVLWDAPRNSPQDPGNSIIRIRLIKDQVPRVRVASPDGTPRLVELDVTIKGNYVQAELPSFEIWQIIVIDAPRDLEEGNVHE